MFSAASLTVSSMRLWRVAGRLALAIHHKMFFLDDRGKAWKCSLAA